MQGVPSKRLCPATTRIECNYLGECQRLVHQMYSLSAHKLPFYEFIHEGNQSSVVELKNAGLHAQLTVGCE